MSLQPMKFVTVTGPLDTFDQVVRQCILNRQFHPESALQIIKLDKRLRPLDADNPAAPLLRQADSLLERLGMTPDYRAYPEEFTLEYCAHQMGQLGERLDELDRQADQLRQEAADDRHFIQQLERFSSINVDLESLRQLRHMVFRFGNMPEESYRSFREALEKREDCFFFPTKVEDGQVYGCYFALRRQEEVVDALFASMHFVQVPLSQRAEGTAEKAIEALAQEAEADDLSVECIAQQVQELAREEGEGLLMLRSWLCRENQVMDLRRYAARSQKTFCIMGWVPQDGWAEFEAQLEGFGGLDYVVDAPEETGVVPPSKLKTTSLGKIFEPFLKMYGLPNYNEYDPSTFMAVTYCLFFGIMFGDVGQGALLVACGLFMGMARGLWLGQIIACCGVSSTVFGFVYGSVFGFEDIIHGFKILEGDNVVYLLLASLGLGVAMIGYAMLMNICNGIRQRNFDKIFFGPNGLAGMVFYFGLIAAAVLALLDVVNLFQPVYVMLVLVLPLVVILFREPLTKLAQGDKQWKPASMGELLIGGFFELFETLLSFLTNTLSFLRVGAYAITHVALMLVVHALAGSGNLAVLVVGNLFVMGMESVMVCIQVLRLEFYEMFGRFYQNGGREFRPHVVDYSAKLH